MSGTTQESDVNREVQAAAQAEDVTRLLNLWFTHPDARNEVCRLLMPFLHQKAGAFMRHESNERTLQTTALVNEAILKLLKNEPRKWRSRDEFVKYVGGIMTRVLISYARKRKSKKRGEDDAPVPMRDDDIDCRVGANAIEETYLLFESLASRYPQNAEVVKLRYLGGYSFDEIAGSLEISAERASALYQFGMAWMKKQSEE